MDMKKGLKRLKTFIERHTPLMSELVRRDVKLKYRRSVLGYLWSLLNPLMMMTIMTLVFSRVFRYDMANYPLYLICGQTLFSFFNESTNKAMYSVIDNGPLIKKVYIPKFIFPVSKVLSCFVTMAFSLAAILIVMLFTRTPLHWSMLLFWAPILLLLLFCCGMGMILSALSVKFRDVTHLYSVLTTAWMYLTPVFYPMEAISGWIKKVVSLNPLTMYITLFRSLMLDGVVPAAGAWLSALGVSVLMLGLGAWVFGKMQREFILYI